MGIFFWVSYLCGQNTSPLNYEFTIGEVVKLLHDRSEARILQIYPNGRVVVLIDDLLEMEVSADELVKKDIPLPKTEQEKKQLAKKLSPQETDLAQTLHFAMELENELKVNYHLINHTAYTVIFALFNQSSLKEGDTPKGIVHGVLTPASCQYLFSVKTETWETHNNLLFDFIYFSDKNLPRKAPEARDFRLRNKHFYGENLVWNPYLNKDTVIIPFQEQEKKVLRSAEVHQYQINEKLLPFDQLKRDIIEMDRVEPIVDLHMDRLVSNYSDFKAHEMYRLQIETFERCLSLAVAHGLPEITFIHGIGNGRLREEIHRRLKNFTFVREYAIDRTEKFGQGATTVYL